MDYDFDDVLGYAHTGAFAANELGQEFLSQFCRYKMLRLIFGCLGKRENADPRHNANCRADFTLGLRFPFRESPRLSTVQETFNSLHWPYCGTTSAESTAFIVSRQIMNLADFTAVPITPYGHPFGATRDRTIRQLPPAPYRDTALCSLCEYQKFCAYALR